MTPIWWLLIFPPALLALYFLKLKRQELPVSSTLLWKRSLEDLHVNSPFQRLRRSLLFFLQLLILLLLIVAAWTPRCSTEAVSGGNLLVLIDNSASMNASEEEGTRLELAVKEALKLVNTLGSGDRMMLLTFSSRTTTIQPLTGDRDLLEAKIRSVTPTSLPTNLVEALSNAHSLAEALPKADVFILGDGCYGDLSALPPEAMRLNLRFIGNASALDNAAITEADVRRTFGRERRTEVFALVHNFSREERSMTVSLLYEGTLQDARELSIPAGEAANVVFDVSQLAPGMVSVELDAEDALQDDNRVFLEISPPREIAVVVVGKENEWVDLALVSKSTFSFRRVSRAAFRGVAMRKQLEGGNPPVVVFDRWIPEEVPLVPALFIGCHPRMNEGTAQPTLEERPMIIDWDRSHPVNRFLVYSPVNIQESLVFQPGPTFRYLVDTDRGSIIGVLTRPTDTGGTVPGLVIGFDILKSNWPVGHFSFPIFFSNAVTWLGERYGEQPSRWRTGEPLVTTTRNDGSTGDTNRSNVEIRAPNGETTRALLEKSGSVVFGDPDQVGVYDFLVDSERRQGFGVALLDDKESSLSPLEKIDLGEFDIKPEARLVDESRDLWAWFALAAVVIMILEWYVYHRRVYL